MRLKHLTLQGYKSFATKTEFLFPTGVTAVIGPNGSGKSNIADGIRWVLGERSIRALRGKSTADMIFAGGRRRARAGMAEASLTFDNSNGWLPIEFSEVTITRRAYRSGENEYLINGAQVLLRDIESLLAESGLSQRTYTVIGQGLVDAALSLRPQERRTLFEEAAGISLYRAQREKSVERLDETERNLERVRDIIGEVTPRLRRLEREMELVEEHRRVTAHLERLQRTWYGYRWGRQQARLDNALKRVAALKSRLDAQQGEVSELDERLLQLRQQESELRAKLRDWHRESAALHDCANDAQRELAVAEERTRLLKARRDELLAEMEPLTKQQEAQAEKVAQTQAQVEQLERELVERQKRLAGHEREWEAAQEQAQEPERQYARIEQELRAHRAELERLNETLLEARAEASRLASEQAVAQERAHQLKTRREEVLAELGPLGDQHEKQARQVAQARALVEQQERDLAERQKQLAELERAWAAARQQAPAPDRRGAQMEQALRSRRAELERLNESLIETRAEAERLAGEQEALDRMYTAGDAGGVGVRALLQADLEGVIAPLATLIQVPAQWERAVEAALGADLQALVVERAAIVERACQILDSAGGRLTLLPLDGLRPPPSLPPAATSAAGVVACDERVRPAVETLLGGVALCDDLPAARALLPSLPPGGRCVTPTGVVLRADGALLVGKARTGGVLAGERARRELPARLEEARTRCREIEKQQRAERGQIAALEAELEKLARQAEQAREEAARVEQERVGEARTAVAVAGEALRNRQAVLQREESLLEQLRAKKAALRKQADRMEAERAAITVRVQELQAEAPRTEAQSGQAQAPQGFQARIEEAHRRCREIEERQSARSQQIAALEARLEQLARQAAQAREEAARIERETVGQARTAVAVAGESLRSQQATLRRERALLEQLRAQEAARRQRAEELKTEHESIVARARRLRAEAAEVESQLRQVRACIEPAEGKLEQLREEQMGLEEQEQRARERVRYAEASHGRAQLDVERRRDELKLLARRIEEDLGLVELELAESVTAQTPLPLQPLVSQLPIVEELPEGLKEEIQRVKARLRRLRSVNPNAPADYAEVQERHQFLTRQTTDLEAASAQLRQVVAELDDLMETAFRETFDAVAARFSETFATLFEGGAARLELTEPGDLMNTGVDIIARPPGKRAQRLALLSGGERALTASALLFAILHVSPTPFCVLDEVDAMLDEANAARFRALLEELSQQTQFIVITHNRSTVEAADTLYGISMGADGVSQVVSLKLDKD